ncbi:MAG: RNA polymerase sigma factor [Acidimicrobiaceae bacterium]|nr:RNA polymerase sigma factor [Acidimicrobiaceae bacterium]
MTAPALSLDELRAGLGSEARTLAALERAVSALRESTEHVSLDTEGIWGKIEASRARVRRPDELRASFHHVYADNVRDVHAFIRRRVGAASADDLTAETFCRAYRSFHRWEDRGVPIRAWLLRIAYNQVVGQARKTTPVPVAEPEHHLPPHGEHDAEADRGLETDAALKALSSLPASHRTVLELRHLNELSVPETATVLGLSEEATRALTYRAMKGLRKAYAQQAAASS